MKHITAFILLCALANMTHAWTDHCKVYHVHIENIGTSDCVLKKQYILYGKLAPASKIPNVIFRGKHAQFEMTGSQPETYLAAACLLNYECGDDKKITFFTTTSTDAPAWGHFDETRSSIIESKNIVANFESTRCNNFNSTANEITWTLNP